MKLSRPVLFGTSTILAALAFACGGDDGSPIVTAPAATAIATATGTPTPRAEPTMTTTAARDGDGSRMIQRAATARATRTPGTLPGASASTTPATGPGVAKPARDFSAYTSRIDKDVTYCIADGVALLMDVYYPKTLTSGLETALLYVHGGGWVAGDKTAGEGIADIPELLGRGYVIFAVNYRLAPEFKFPAQIEDVKCAVRSIRANAASYGIDPDNIGAWGGSAGGHLVNMLGTTDGDEGFEGNGGYAGVSSRVQAVVDYFGPSDFTVEFAGGGRTALANVFGIAGGNSDPRAASVSPVTYVSSDDPPFAIFQGEEDILVVPDQSERLYAALQAAGVESYLTMVANAGHSFSASGGTPSPTRGQITKSMADFFDAQLR